MARFHLQRTVEAPAAPAAPSPADPRTAIEQLRQAGGDASKPETYLTIARLQMELQSFEEAIESLTRCLELDASNWTARLNLAKCYEKLNRWQSAAAEFRAALELDPDRAEAQVGLGICLLHLNKPAEAMRSFEIALERNPKDQAAMTGRHAAEMLLARLQQSGKRFGKIRPDAAAPVVEEAPDLRPSLLALIEKTIETGDLEGASRYSEELLRAGTPDFAAWMSAGWARHASEDYSGAREAYRQAAALRPESADAWLNAGIASQQLGDVRAAREALEAALQAEPGCRQAAWNLALLQEQAGDLREAERLYEMLSAGEPAAEPAFRLGVLRMERGEFAAAAAAFEAAIAGRAGWPEASLHLAVTNWKLGRSDAARNAFAAVLEGEPENVEALFGLAVLALDGEDAARAMELLRRMIELGEKQPALAFNIAMLLEKRGAPAADLAWLYGHAVEADAEFADAWLNLGNVLEALGERDRAVACWRKAMEQKPELARGYFG